MEKNGNPFSPYFLKNTWLSYSFFYPFASEFWGILSLFAYSNEHCPHSNFAATFPAPGLSGAMCESVPANLNAIDTIIETRTRGALKESLQRDYFAACLSHWPRVSILHIFLAG